MAVEERQAMAGQAVELPEPWRSAAVTVVLPTYNEAANLPVIVAELFALPLPSLRILVADDNSPDGTGAVADRLAGDFGGDRLTVVHRQDKQGLGRAYVDGMTRAVAAGAEFVVQMDSDLSHAPEYLPQMLGTLLATGADVVIGSRYVAGASLATEWSLRRRALSAFANAYVRALLRLGIRDVTAGFKIWRSSALQTIDVASIRSNGYSFQVEMNYRSVRHRLKIVEVPIHFAERREGESKMNVWVQLESALMPFLLRRRARQRPAASATSSAVKVPVFTLPLKDRGQVNLGALAAAARHVRVVTRRQGAPIARQAAQRGSYRVIDTAIHAHRPNGTPQHNPSPASTAVSTKNVPGEFGFSALGGVQQARTAGGFDLEPPDQGLCAGGGYVVEFINDALAIYDKNGAQLLAPIGSDAVFDHPAGGTAATGQPGR